MKKKIRKLGLIIALICVFMMIVPSVHVAADQQEKVNVLILFDQKPGAVEEALIQAFDGEIKYTYDLIPTIAATIPVNAIKGLEKNPHILAIEEDVMVQATAESYDWGADAIEADLVQSMTTYDGTGIKVAVVDTGIDFSNSDLPDTVRGYNVLKTFAAPKDDNGHGTHVAGIIAATIGNDIGVIGVAPDVELYAVKVLDRFGNGYISDIIAGIEWCVENDIQVANNSYGASSDPGISYEMAYQNAEEAGVLLIGAAGNTGIDSDDPTASTVIYPAAYDSVMAVAAVDSDLNRAYFSSVGGTVEISAPGVAITSTYSKDRLAIMSGTSMAAPFVTGVAALLMDQGIYTNPEEVRAQMNSTAQDLGTTGWDSWYGYGMVRADLALDIKNTELPENTSPVINITSPENGSSFETGESIVISGTADDAEDGELSGSILWRIEETSETYTGSSFNTSFDQPGTYTIYAQVQDAEGIVVSEQVMITVNDPVNNETDIMQIISVNYDTISLAGGKFDKLFIGVSIVDSNLIPLVNAEVTIEIMLDGEVYDVVTATTDNSGTANYSFNKVPKGIYIAYPASVELAGYVLDETAAYFNEGIIIE